MVAAAPAALLVGLARRACRRSARRRAASRSVEIVVDGEAVRRALGDGRSESARWGHLDHVEVVRTPVRTADGADVFALLAEISSEDEPHGCLVPLGVGYDEILLDRLVRLERFDLAAWSRAVDGRSPRRIVVWRRDAQPGTGGGPSVGTGSA